jgi:hypothetical protein
LRVGRTLYGFAGTPPQCPNGIAAVYVGEPVFVFCIVQYKILTYFETARACCHMSAPSRLIWMDASRFLPPPHMGSYGEKRFCGFMKYRGNKNKKA